MIDIGSVFKNRATDLNSTVEGYYLARSYKSDAPYTLITDLPFEEAVQISKQSYPQRSSNYMHDRYSVDDWLREQAKKADVNIDRHNPVSFSLIKGIEQWKEGINPADGIIIIPFENVDLSTWSFTIDDSFVSAPSELIKDDHIWINDYPSHTLHGKVLNAEQVTQALKNEELPDENINGNPRYFEAQMWADVPRLLNNANLDRTEGPSPKQAFTP